jgi:hypothetical protein
MNFIVKAILLGASTHAARTGAALARDSASLGNGYDYVSNLPISSSASMKDWIVALNIS